MVSAKTPVRIPLLDLKTQYAAIRTEVEAAIGRVVESQQFVLGPEVESLEREIAEYSGVKHAVGVSSGTDALLATLMALGVGPGDEVVTTPFTFVATCSAIARLGAKAAFVDIEPGSFNLDAGAVERAIGARTKAIVVVHLFGQMAEMTPILEAARARAIPVVEDAAQALGAELGGVRAGAWGTAAAFSFFPSKNLGAFGDGGMVVTNDDQIAERVRLLRNQGQRPKYFAVAIGGNFRLDALQAAVLRAKLPYLDGWIEARARNVERYRAMFDEAGLGELGVELGVELPGRLPGRRHVWNQFVIRSKRRDALRERLTERGIGTEVYYPQPMHLQACFAEWRGAPGDFPEAERACAEALALPIYPELTEEMQEAVVGAVRDSAREADRAALAGGRRD